MKARKTLERILAGSKNISFADRRRLVEAFGFRLTRVNGSHHIFRHSEVTELVNLQEVGGQANPIRFVSS